MVDDELGWRERLNPRRIAAELGDRFGPLPEEVENLLGVMVVKGLCRQANIAKIDAGPRGATLSFRDNFYANPGGLVQFISTQAGTAKLRPDHTLVYRRNWEEADERLKGVRHLVENLAVIAAQAPGRGSAKPVAAAPRNKTPARA